MVILDASVVYKWFAKNEEDSSIALNILQRHMQGREKIVVPDLILYELTNAWVTKTAIPFIRVKVNLKDLQDASLKIESPTFDLAVEAATFAKKYKTSVYDAYYLILARKKKCNFITADNRLLNQVSLPFVKRLKDYK